MSNLTIDAILLHGNEILDVTIKILDRPFVMKINRFARLREKLPDAHID